MSNNGHKQPITAVIIAKNEADMIASCLDCLQWCEQVLVIDTGSTDDTAALAENRGAQVIHFVHRSFAKVRNEAIKYVKQPWVLYIDADERVTPKLAQEIGVSLETNAADVFSFRRENIFFGRKFSHGGWGKDQVTRLFRKTALEQWTGEIHESPSYSGQRTVLNMPLIHFSHRNVADGLRKSASWTKMEAEEYVRAGFQKVTVWTVLRKILGELYRRLLRQRGYADGEAGVFEAIIQACNKAFVFIQVWELQQKPSIREKYQAKEKEINTLWQKNA